MKRKSQVAKPKQLKGPFKQADSMADKGGKRKSKARDKRLERAAV